MVKYLISRNTFFFRGKRGSVLPGIVNGLQKVYLYGRPVRAEGGFLNVDMPDGGKHVLLMRLQEGGYWRR